MAGSISLLNRPIIVIGLGYVGLPLAVAFGKKRATVGYDIDTSRIAHLRNGIDLTNEIAKPELDEAIYLRYETDLIEVKKSLQDDNAIFIVTVPTPIDRAKRPDLEPLIQATKAVASIIKRGDVVIYESTVYPGATEEVCVPILEAYSGISHITESNEKDKPGGFFTGYSPERINPGDKIRKLPNIKKVVSGSTSFISEEIAKLYSEIISAGIYRAASIRVAEAAKVIENAQRDINIAFINELSVIFAKMGIDTTEVLEAAETKWNFLPFRPGLVGGHCIGVDPYYLTHKSEQLGYRPEVILAGRGINDRMGTYAAQVTTKKMVEGGINISGATVGIMGVTFKENCGDIRNSRVIDMIREFQSWGLDVVVVDPHARTEDVYREYGFNLAAEFLPESLDSLVIAVKHDVFKTISIQTLIKYFKKNPARVIADLKAILPLDDLIAAGFSVYRM